MGFSPLDDSLQLGAHCWTPETVKQMVKLGTEIPSYRRAAENFSELTKVGVSKSRLGELVKLYGGKIVVQQEAEATAMVKAPAKEDVKAYLEAFEAKFVDPQKAFRQHLKQSCSYFAYPQGESNDLTIAMLKKHGYKAAFTRKRGSNPFFADNFKIKRSVVYGHHDMDRFRQNLATFHNAELK